MRLHFGQRFPEAMKRIEQCNILLIGDTGVGKSTLIRTLLNLDNISSGVTLEISSPYKHPELPFRLYDSPGLEWQNKKADSTKNKIINFIKDHNRLEPKEQIHAVWYCVNSQVTRKSEIDDKWLKGISQFVPVIAVITKSLDGKDENLRRLLQEIQCIRGISSVMAEATQTTLGNIETHGWQQLLDKTETLLNEIAEQAIQNAINQKKIVAVHWCALGLTGVIGAQFVPGVRSMLSSGFQTWIFHDIAKNFGHKFSKKDINQLLQGAGIYGSLVLFDASFENLLSHLPGLDYNNIQSVQQISDHIIAILENTSEFIPFKENFVDILQQLSGINLVAGLPVLSVLSALATTFSTIALASIWVDVMEDYTRCLYEDQPIPDLSELLSQKINQFKDFLATFLTQVTPETVS